MTANELKARDFAIIAHGKQKYGSHPYIKHLDDVYNVAVEFGLSEDVKIAAFLHDTIEDTTIDMSDIEKMFGYHIACLVDGVTNKYEEHRQYIMISNSGSECIELKLCDRIANVRQSKEDDHPIIRKYVVHHKKYNLGKMFNNAFVCKKLLNEYIKIIES